MCRHVVPVNDTFFCETQNIILFEMSQWFVSIQWKSMGVDVVLMFSEYLFFCFADKEIIIY